jgi:2-dehydro-3-deoxyphosphooctonate aldolase (KDO 8-P synthase)
MNYTEFSNKPFFILGPCVIESMDLLNEVAKRVSKLKAKYQINIIFKASFDKANRTSINSFRGPGLEKGLEMLSKIKQDFKLNILTDIHEPWQAEKASIVADIIQIPAFLCRQTDLLIAAAKTDKIINIKKAQFLSGEDMFFPAQKVFDSGNKKILLTERGNTNGPNNLVVDYRNIVDMKKLGYPVIMDCTHAVQKPGGLNGKTGGNSEYIPYLAKAAKAVGVNGYFFEVHPSPEKALSDGPNMLNLKSVESLIFELIK